MSFIGKMFLNHIFIVFLLPILSKYFGILFYTKLLSINNLFIFYLVDNCVIVLKGNTIIFLSENKKTYFILYLKKK